jgi:hypothetical protein
MKLKPNETDLLGKWEFIAGSVVRDATCERIETLVEHYLQKVAVDESGWDTLYKDPEDNRYWELTYPNSDWHGGGPPRLTYLSDEQVKAKYPHVVT